MQILIIGAGLGGLSLAQGLVRAGFSVTVFERDISPFNRMQGYRISMRRLGMQALQELLPPEKWALIHTARVTDVGDGFICATEKMQPLFTLPKGEDAVVQLLRSELRTLLQEGVSIEWGKRLVSYEEKDGQIVAHFDDGSQASGDLLVGCDGANSRVRELLPSVYGNRLGSIPTVIDAQNVVFGGQIDRTNEWEDLLPLNKVGMVRFVGSNGDLGVCFSERADRSPTVFWAFSQDIEDRKSFLDQLHADSDWAKSLHDCCKQLIDHAGWHENLKKLILCTPKEGMMPPWLIRTTQFPDTDQYPMTPSARVTLLGDAAHAMPPHKALGGSHVLEDARLLTQLLVSSSTDWRSSIERYEREMFARAKIAVEESNHVREYFRTLLTKESV